MSETINHADQILDLPSWARKVDDLILEAARQSSRPDIVDPAWVYALPFVGDETYPAAAAVLIAIIHSQTT